MRSIRRQIEETMALLRTPVRRNVECATSIEHASVRGPKPANLAAPRICVNVDMKYAAWYILQRNGHYRHSRCGMLTDSAAITLFSHAEAEQYLIDQADIGEEICAFCRVSGKGGLGCYKCGLRTCWGSVVDGQWWSCRRSCGATGRVVMRATANVGFVPKVLL